MKALKLALAIGLLRLGWMRATKDPRRYIGRRGVGWSVWCWGVEVNILGDRPWLEILLVVAHRYGLYISVLRVE